MCGQLKEICSKISSLNDEQVWLGRVHIISVRVLGSILVFLGTHDINKHQN